MRSRVYACAHAAFKGGRKFSIKMCTNGFAAIQIRLTSRFDFSKYSAGHIITRGEFTFFMIIGHEAYAFGIGQNGAFTAQSFGGEGGRVAANIYGGRVELNKFHIAHFCANDCGHAERISARRARVGRDGK